jgi:pimeloyl-ACP methyl ester carboxylesterase
LKEGHALLFDGQPAAAWADMHDSGHVVPLQRLSATRRHWLRQQFAGWCTIATLGSGCALFIPPVLPRMEVLRIPGRCRGRAPTLVVMLPGAYSRPPEFVEAGFPLALREAGVAADICIADSHVGYYSDRSILTRLREEIVLPARAAGYRQIWLVGISLGGFGALGYAVRHGGDIDGVLALAPYLGPRRLTQEMAQAGGALAWGAAAKAASGATWGTTSAATIPEADAPDELDREVWQVYAGPYSSRPALPVHLGYGLDDRFADANRRFGELLPPARVATAPGGHDWPVWRALWQAWLAQGLLTVACESA